MSKIHVFTPTCRYGGVDVTHGSLNNQTEESITWIVSDDLADERRDMWFGLPTIYDLIWGSSPKRKESDHRNLVAAYNSAVALTLEDPEAKLFVTLQDYIWIPHDGLERFMALHEEYPRALLTGLCSISLDPTPDKVVNPEGHYTVFAEPFWSEPRIIDWPDCRNDSSQARPGNHQEWEANWGAVPVQLLREGLRWTPEYDRGVAYENQDLALQAINYMGSSVVLDPNNHAISLPHKSYFPSEEKNDAPHNNRYWHEARWAARGIEA